MVQNRQNRQNRQDRQDNWVGESGKSDRFDVLELNLRRPVEATAKGLLWWFALVPAGIGLVWGVYNKDNIASVLGVSARRAAGSVITETQPVGVRLLRGVSGESDRIESPSGCINLIDPNAPCVERRDRL